jgi:hypothetical protein
VEVSGTSEQVKKRVDRVKELLRHAESSGGALVVSVISYGAHSFERKVRDEPAVERAWAATSAGAIAALDKLELHVPVAGDYPYAAQLECALKRIAPKVRAEQGRPVLLVAGGRRPHPPRTDHKSDLLPCPSRTDWREQLGELVRRHPLLTAGVIYDQGADEDVFWGDFGATVLCNSDVVEAWRFGAGLGIGGPPVHVPFPLTGQDGD